MPEHSPEPWRAQKTPDGYYAIVSDVGEFKILAFLSAREDPLVANSDANRIAACVNFLAGVPTEDLLDLMANPAVWSSELRGLIRELGDRHGCQWNLTANEVDAGVTPDRPPDVRY